MQSLKRSQIRLAFEDGTEVVADVKPLDLIKAERQYGEKLRGHAAEATLYAAYVSLGAPGSPERSFDQWLASLVAFDEGEVDAKADPTTEAASADAPQS